MYPAAIIFSNTQWLLPVAILLAIGGLLVTWSYYRRVADPLCRWACPLLKIAGMGALLTCLLEPLWSGQRARPGANVFAIVADNSQGLQIRDTGAEKTRAETLKELLQSDTRWQAALAENFEVRRYFFDARLQPTRDFLDMSFSGPSSALGTSLQALIDRFKGRPLAGILVLTDGNATDLGEAAIAPGAPPIYPVVIGTQNPVRDVALEHIAVTETDFEDTPVSVQADARVSGYEGESIVAELIDSAGQLVKEQSLRSRGDREQVAFRFQFQPAAKGLSFYQVRLRAKGEAASNKDSQSSEATLANNDRVVVVDRREDAYRVFYVAGRPNWEYKFLNRALAEDKQLALAALIRVAHREPKFNFIGRSGETSNPLFRGFGDQSAEDVERYDQPVLVRLNTRDEIELRTGFPQTAADLYAYDAVILDDLEAGFFTPDQAMLLQKFVSERGGGFAMLGGMESFQNGGYQHTSIGDMLPVYLEPVEITGATEPLRLELTREGLFQSWARLRETESQEQTRLAEMARFEVLNRVRAVKPGATVVATATAHPDGPHFPAIIIQKFGRGRVAAITIGDLWRWGLRDAEGRKDMDKGWRQFVRWLVSEVPARIELTARKDSTNASPGIALQARVLDEQFQPMNNAFVRIEVEQVMPAPPAKSEPLRLIPEESSVESGLYEATYVPQNPGGFRATAYVTNSAGLEIGHATAGWATDPAADEFRSLTPNLPLLESLARRSGGEIVRATSLESFARKLPNRRAPIMEPWTTPAWHTPTWFGFALFCFVAEWGLRRWKGLA